MADERIEFLYGPGVDPYDLDLDDLDVRSELLEHSFEGVWNAVELATCEMIAGQILDDNPPEVWATVQRLSQSGIDRESIFTQLVVALAPVRLAALEPDRKADPAVYAEALARLPLPTGPEIEQAMTEAVRRSPGISPADSVTAALKHLGRPSEDTAVRAQIDRAMDDLVDRRGPLAFAGGDHLVHVGDLTSRIVLTHVVTAFPHPEGLSSVLDAAFDLSGFDRRDHLRLHRGDHDPMSALRRGRFGWLGPEGWLDDFPAGTVLAVRVDRDGVVDIEALPEAPACDEDLVARVRAGYDRSVEDPWLPVEGEELVLTVLLEDPHAFDKPVAPLSELAAAAGLERRGTSVAHDETVWRNELRSRRTWRVFDYMDGDRDSALRVLHALDVADLVSGVDPDAVPDIEGPVDTSMLREVLADLGDDDVLSNVLEELYENLEPGGRPRARAFADALISAATKPRDVASARLIAAIGSEKGLEPHAAEQHLELAHEADPGFAIVTDRLAWYASDRGDAAKAARLWRRLAPSASLAQDLAAVEGVAKPTHAALGRNERCWCGSGRKYKQCHLGSTEPAPLPDRVGWLCRKAIAFVERAGAEAQSDVFDIAEARAGSADRAAMADAFADPIVTDLALTEGGWFERFLEERGPLLPDDEAILAASWILEKRSVYEVLKVRPGSGLELRDLRSGDRISVRERSFSHDVSPGALVCARAVPDGHTHQFVGGLFPVHPGHEEVLLDLLDTADPFAIASWVGGLYRSPTLQTREGEPLVECDLVVDVGDASAARAFLDATYGVDATPGTDTWAEKFPLDDDETILRARIRLDGTRLTVSTMSEERAERVLAAIRAALADAVVVSDERTPMDAATLTKRKELEDDPSPHGADVVDPWTDDPEATKALMEMRERYELRWCDESIPALGGFTPREAAADPTRREGLLRLIAGFEGLSPPGAVTMRPARLRELLDL